MRRREFALTASALAGSTILPGCGGGGTPAQIAAAATTAVNDALPGMVSVIAPPPAPAAPAVIASGTAMGTNLSGMEWAQPGLRYGQSTGPNLHFTVPRSPDVAYLAGCGYSKNRLPIQWELLQPVLHDTVASATVKTLVGNPGEFHATYESYITNVLDAHAAAGIKCIIDLHNYCRYQDFKFQSDGSVLGLTAGPGLLRPYTTDGSQVQVRIFALAAGATLKQSNFTDFWTRVATKWKGHPGLGGYGLMNEPHDLPQAGAIIGSYNNEDLTIWPTYAQAAINAIRALDTTTPIYVAGNEWSAAMTVATKNPAWTLQGSNLIYEVHMYLDAQSTGAYFDYDTEVAKNFSAGLSGSINANTGFDRLKIATDWAAAKGVKLALTEVGMPIDDPRWQEAFKRAVNHARQAGCEVYSWMGGNHWPIHNYAINQVPGWHQNKTLEPLVSGPLKAAAGIAQASLFDDGPGHAPSGTAVTITVYARGNLATPVVLGVTSSNGGTLSSAQITIPAGANSQATFTYTSGSNRVSTLTYTSDGQLSGQVPPPRKVFSLTDPVAYAATSLPDAAMAIIAKYSACKWDLSQGHTDYMQGVPAADGQAVRALSDSGYGSSPGNAMEMLNWINKENAVSGNMTVPVMRVTNGKKNSDHSVYDTHGFWCKKTSATPGIQANPTNRVPYNIEHGHFAIAAVSVPGTSNTGVLFQASKAEQTYCSELAFNNSQPQARWVDSGGQSVSITSPTRLTANAPAVVAFTSVQGAQSLRVNCTAVASANATFAPSAYAQMLIGWGFLSYYPRDGFRGNVYAVITGKGAPTAAEMTILERYLGTTAGMTL